MKSLWIGQDSLDDLALTVCLTHYSATWSQTKEEHVSFPYKGMQQNNKVKRTGKHCHLACPHHTLFITLTIMTAPSFPIDLLKADLPMIVQALDSGMFTSEQLVQEYISECLDNAVSLTMHRPDSRKQCPGSRPSRSVSAGKRERL